MAPPRLDDPEVFALATRTNLPVRLARLLLLLARATDAKMRLAIGGAVAAHDAGWRRYTEDLDVFARPVTARRLIKALKAQGASTFWITDAHAVAYLHEDNAAALAAGEAPGIRIDVLSTVTEPEASAIRTAVPARALGVPVKVFRTDHLAAIKYLAGRPQDLMDFDELVLRGVDVDKVRYIVATADESQVAAMMARVRKLTALPRGVREPRAGRYLGREAFHAAWAAAVAGDASGAATRGAPPRAEARGRRRRALKPAAL